MNKFEELCQTASDTNVDIIDYSFTSKRIKGLYCDGTIALNRDMYIETEKACVLAEELGHHYTTVGDIMDQTDTANRKQERRARIWAYHKLLSLNDLVDSYKHGCQNQFEIAEHLNVTEEFLMDCLSYYKEKYGLYVRQDNYVIYFEPLGILDIYEMRK
jgi:Zn-dependent peptidase ImmA (M78 family)